MTDTSTAPHLGDSELLHLVDGDASAFELDRWAQHVLACGGCSRRLEVLRRRTARLSALLSDVQPPEGFAYPELSDVPPAWRRRRTRDSGSRTQWMRAAVVALALIAPLALVQPLRAWVADQFSAGWGRVAALAGGEQPDGAPPPAAPAPRSRIWFTAVGPEFVIEIASAQPDGRLILRAAQGSEGSLEVVGGAGETPVLIQGGVRVLNGPHSHASYELTLPHSLERVRVRLGGEPWAVLSHQEIARGRLLELRRSAGR
jgi:hypothetical protein